MDENRAKYKKGRILINVYGPGNDRSGEEGESLWDLLKKSLWEF